PGARIRSDHGTGMTGTDSWRKDTECRAHERVPVPRKTRVVSMELIDSHAHIDFPQFAEDREAMLERARAVGVTTLLAIGTGPGPEKLDAAIPFAEQHDWIYATVGIHPHEAKEVTQQHLDELARLAEHPTVIGWREIGLDYV